MPKDYKYVSMPPITDETAEIVSKVRSIYPNAIMFYGTHVYRNLSLSDKVFCIGLSDKFKIEDSKVVEFDYERYRISVTVLSKWQKSLDLAWSSAWELIQIAMLDKLKK